MLKLIESFRPSEKNLWVAIQRNKKNVEIG